MRYRGNRLATFLIFAGLGIIVYAAVRVTGGGLADGLRTMENGTYVAFQLAADALTALTCFTGGALWLAEHRRAPVFVLFGLGALTCTGLNTMAHRVATDPVISVFFALVSVVGLIGLYWFVRGLVSKPTGR